VGHEGRPGRDLGVDYVIGKHPIDRTKVATIGHSYGGFMTNWLITQYPTASPPPHRARASRTGRAITRTRTFRARRRRSSGAGPWDPKARETMIKQSPIMYANRVKTPTLFINGEIDKRVPYSEISSFYVAIKKQGVPAKMIQYAISRTGSRGLLEQRSPVCSMSARGLISM
jgi:dipeptidyl aminopeptidase/acylaminoacyl peptidase